MAQELVDWIQREKVRREAVDFATRELSRAEPRRRELRKALEHLSEVENPDLQFLEVCISKRIAEIDREFDTNLKDACSRTGLVIDGTYPEYTISNQHASVRLRVLEPFSRAEVNGYDLNGKLATPAKIVQRASNILHRKRRMIHETDLERFASVLRSCYETLRNIASPNEGIVRIAEVLSLVRAAYSQRGIGVDALQLLGTVYDQHLLPLEMYPSRRPEDSVKIPTREGPRLYALMRIAEKGPDER